MSISASAFHDFSSETQKRCKVSTREMTSPIMTMQNKGLLLTRGILVKYDFGVFKKVFSNDEDLLSTPHWTAVQWLLQYFRHSCWLGCKHSRYTSCIYIFKVFFTRATQAEIKWHLTVTAKKFMLKRLKQWFKKLTRKHRSAVDWKGKTKLPN